MYNNLYGPHRSPSLSLCTCVMHPPSLPQPLRYVPSLPVVMANFVFTLECDLSKQNVFDLIVCNHQQFNNLRINSIKHESYEPIDSLCCISVNVIPNKKVCFRLESVNCFPGTLSLLSQWNPIKLVSNKLQYQIENIYGHPLIANCVLHLYIEMQ